MKGKRCVALAPYRLSMKGSGVGGVCVENDLRKIMNKLSTSI